jgi:hypothetical protein
MDSIKTILDSEFGSKVDSELRLKLLYTELESELWSELGDELDSELWFELNPEIKQMIDNG